MGVRGAALSVPALWTGRSFPLRKSLLVITHPRLEEKARPTNTKHHLLPMVYFHSLSIKVLLGVISISVFQNQTPRMYPQDGR